MEDTAGCFILLALEERWGLSGWALPAETWERLSVKMGNWRDGKAKWVDR